MRSRGRHRIAIVVACAAAAVGASFEGCLSFGDLQGATSADASLDGMPIESSSSDVTTGGDSSLDASVLDANPGVPFCANQTDAAFCDDFDQVDAAPLSQWQPPNTNSGSSVMLTTAALSLPNALLVTTISNSGSSLIPANISHQLGGTVTSVRYVYDLLVDFYDVSGSNAFIGPMDERVGLTDTELRLILNETGLQLAGAVTPGDGGATTYPNLGSKISVPSGMWHHVEIDADYSQNPAVVSFIFDSSTIVDHVAFTGATFGVGALTVEAGFLYVSSPTTGWKIRVDNVAVFTQ